MEWRDAAIICRTESQDPEEIVAIIDREAARTIAEHDWDPGWIDEARQWVQASDEEREDAAERIASYNCEREGAQAEARERVMRRIAKDSARH